MARCMQIDELVRPITYMIYEASGKCELARIARTCRAICEPSLDIIWEDMDELCPLFKLLPPYSCNLVDVDKVLDRFEQTFTACDEFEVAPQGSIGEASCIDSELPVAKLPLQRRMVSREIDLKPFQDYASRIKTFTWNFETQDNPTVSTIQSVFGELGSSAGLLPNLRVLYWKMPQGDLLPLVTRLPGENLEKLVLYHNAIPVVVKTLEQLRLSSRLRNLKALEFSVPLSEELGDEEAQNKLGDEVARILENTASLHRLSYMFSFLPRLTVQALAKRQTSTHVQIDVRERDLLALQALAVGNVFPNLISLVLHLDTLAKGTLALFGSICLPRPKVCTFRSR
ncbi:hypothetical protein BKA93DRAFT_216010 [Sparassis latifolia]|uniref:F-box domain-containing protein n=1 Tax=Sparassis crispa TaxID=139825 RepID=A0A401GR55_9APHY|nr:hypothetical protein SCP_0606750 [Sparassis crispa]GBE84696.1 hypothetical protein SCP_0606750 [Sparassis crispa]